MRFFASKNIFSASFILVFLLRSTVFENVKRKTEKNLKKVSAACFLKMSRVKIKKNQKKFIDNYSLYQCFMPSVFA